MAEATDETAPEAAPEAAPSPAVEQAPEAVAADYGTFNPATDRAPVGEAYSIDDLLAFHFGPSTETHLRAARLLWRTGPLVIHTPDGPHHYRLCDGKVGIFPPSN